MAAPATVAREATLVGRAVLPAATFAGGPPSGQYEDRGDHGYRLDAPRFAQQPVQGVSSVKPGPRRGTWWALSDNGFGSKWNSLDYRTCLYLFDDQARLLRRIELRDPRRLFPHRLILDADAARPLTGGDIDPESLVVMPDGSFWIGDEIGPWLLHFSRDGALLSPPVTAEAPGVGVLRSVVHPDVLAARAAANIRASGGFESLVAVGAGRELRLLGLLERPLLGAVDDRELRLLEFDPARRRWTGREWRYRLDAPTHAVAELALATDGALLAIERDSLQGEAARTKRVYRIATPGADNLGGVLGKTLFVDLLAIRDPGHLGGATDLFRFSYWTTEALHALDAHTLLIVNDNNYPAGGGRGGTAPDATEWIRVRIDD